VNLVETTKVHHEKRLRSNGGYVEVRTDSTTGQQDRHERQQKADAELLV